MNPKSKLDGVDLEQFDDEKIILKLLGVMFQVNKLKGVQMKHFFYTDVKDMYSTANFTNILLKTEKYKKNTDEDRLEIGKVMCWYLYF